MRWRTGAAAMMSGVTVSVKACSPREYSIARNEAACIARTSILGE